MKSIKEYSGLSMAKQNPNQRLHDDEDLVEAQRSKVPSTTTTLTSPMQQPLKQTISSASSSPSFLSSSRLIKTSYLGLRQVKKRHLVLMMCMMINALSYTIRTNINMTIVAMVKDDNPDLQTPNNSTNNQQSNSCPNNFNHNKVFDQSNFTSRMDDYYLEDLIDPTLDSNLRGYFDWSESLQGTIVGAYYYGYILTNFNGGQLSEWIGTRRLLAIAIALSSILTLLVPMAAFCHPWLLIIVRILTGLAQGVVTPSIYQLLSYWTPRSELGLAFGLIPASGYIGAVITMPVCAFLSEYGLFGGWPSVFYTFGLVGLVSMIPWLLLVYNSPDAHPTITDEELLFIQHTSMTTKKKKEQMKNGKTNTWVPWCSIISSSKIWAITVTKFCTSWGNLFLMSKLPTYLSQVLNMPITYNSYVNASIYIALGGSYLSWGSVADWVERRQCLGRTASRKLFQTIALLGSAAFMASIPLAGCDIIPIIIMLNLSMITLGLTAGGDSLIIVDVAPDYSGSIYGFSNSIGSLPGFLAPLFVGLMLDQPNINQMQQWSLLFWIGAGIYVFGAIIFLSFVNSNPESWGARKQTINSESSVSNQSIDGGRKSQNIQTSKKQEEESSNRSDSRLSESDPLSNTTTQSSTSSGQRSTATDSGISTTIIVVEPETDKTKKSSENKTDSGVYFIKV